MSPPAKPKKHRLSITPRSTTQSSPIHHAALSNLFHKPIHTKSRDASQERLLSLLSTAISENSHAQVILSGPRKCGKMHMLRKTLSKICMIRNSRVTQTQKRVRVLYIDAIETQNQFVRILRGALMAWVFQEKAARGEANDIDSDEENEETSKPAHQLDNAFDIISEEQLGEIEALIVSLATTYQTYPIIVFRHFDRICKLANKAIYHLLDTSHTMQVGMAIIGVSQSINLHTILDKGTGSTGKLGGIIGSYTRIKSRLYHGKFVLLRAFRNVSEITEAIGELLDVSEHNTLDEELVKVYTAALTASLSEPSIFTPLLLHADCASLVHVCRRVLHTIRERDSLEITLADWSVAVEEWVSCEDRLLHLDSFNNMELCMLLAARDVEQQILTPSQENNAHDQRTEIKKEWFSFADVYTRFMERIGKTTNLDIKAKYANRDHMIPDVSTERAICQVAYASLFDKGFLKRFDKRTVLEDSKARFHQLHPEEIRTHISKYADSFHTSIVMWAEEQI